MVEREFQWESEQMPDFIRLEPEKGIRSRGRLLSVLTRSVDGKVDSGVLIEKHQILR